MFAIQCVGGGLYTFVPGVRNSFVVQGARATTGAIFVAVYVVEAKLHSKISVFFVVQWTIPMLKNEDNGSNVTMFEGVVKELNQFRVDNRDIYGESNDLPAQQVDQKRKTF